MNKTLLFIILSVFSLSAFAQAQKTKPRPIPAKPATAKATVVKPVASPVAFKTQLDSASYAIGMQVANFYKNQGLKNLNTAQLSKAINDIFSGKPPALNDAAANACVNSFLTSASMEKIKPTVAEGEQFLAKNKLKPGVKSTASGIQYEVITEGTGPKPTADNTVKVHYRGSFINGTVFDESYKRGEPTSFPLKQVISGWTEAVQLMPVGSKYKFYIPYKLAYGAKGSGSIPGGSMLIFDIELLEILK